MIVFSIYCMEKITIDFSQTINESWLAMFGGIIKIILNRMFGNLGTPLQVRGSRKQVDSFLGTLEREKKYLDSFMKYGLDNPETYKNKIALNHAIKSFERETGIEWPFK